MKSCLIIIDMQNDFIDGSLGTKEAISIVPKVKARVEKAIANGESLIFTQDTHDANYLDTQEGRKLPVKHCILGTHGHDICDELIPYTKEALQVVDKNTFGYKDMPLYLSSYDRITLIGLCTDICVISNAMLIKAFYPEAQIIIEKDCCAGTTVENHENALKAMAVCQMEIV